MILYCDAFDFCMCVYIFCVIVIVVIHIAYIEYVTVYV